MVGTKTQWSIGLAALALAVAPVAAQERSAAATSVLATGEVVRPGARDPLSEPGARGDFEPEVLRTLRHAYVVAVQRLQSSQACSARFQGLKLDGLVALANSRYRVASRDEEATLCRGAAAITGVNSSDVRVCLKFKTLTIESAATILLHEALHFAGMSEWPADPSAPRAGQINGMLRQSCQL